jgi:hypothetical protein
MSDITMTLMRMAALGLSRTPDLPPALAGGNTVERADNLLKLQAEVADELTRHTQDAIRAALGDLARRVIGDPATLAKIMAAVPGVTMEEAVSVALRVCAGCTEGAKAVRETAMAHPASGVSHEQDIEEAERRAMAQYLKRESAGDAVYADGVSIGPLDKKERNKQVPTFDGIDQADQNALWAEYFRRNPRGTN